VMAYFQTFSSWGLTDKHSFPSFSPDKSVEHPSIHSNRDANGPHFRLRFKRLNPQDIP
jgi:hypothetical protein